MSRWDRLAASTEDLDLSTVTDGKWQELLEDAGYQPDSADQTVNSHPAPRLAVVIDEPDEDKISYLSQILTYATALGAEVTAYGPDGVGKHPKVSLLLKELDLERSDIFVECNSLSRSLDGLRAARQYSAHINSVPFGTEGQEGFDEYLAMFAGRESVEVLRETDRLIAELEEQMSTGAGTIIDSMGGLALYGLDEDISLGLRITLRPRVEQLKARRARIIAQAGAWQQFKVTDSTSTLQRRTQEFDAELIEIVDQVNNDPNIHGGLIMLPVGDSVRSRLSRSKDLDGVSDKDPTEQLTPRAAIEIAERHLGYSLTQVDPQKIFLAGAGEQGRALLRQLQNMGITPGTVLWEADDVFNYETIMAQNQYSVGFTMARGTDIISAIHIDADPEGLLLVDAAGNVDRSTLDPLHHLAVIGTRTTKNLFDKLIQEWAPKPRSNAARLLTALGGIVRRVIDTALPTRSVSHEFTSA
jgi:hypothetical protein